MQASGAQSGSPIVLDGALRAGFLMARSGRKSFCAFVVQNGSIAVRRTCTKKEKKALAKKVYGQKSVHSLPHVTDDGRDCLLFVER
ncbi:hypothetical protein HYW59_04735 [Candidatus Kaiserbacteria bacterium]|nr:hypothetical protein [Candidatus Kaiserbacteria bacterium]